MTGAPRRAWAFLTAAGCLVATLRVPTYWVGADETRTAWVWIWAHGRSPIDVGMLLIVWLWVAAGAWVVVTVGSPILALLDTAPDP